MKFPDSQIELIKSKNLVFLNNRLSGQRMKDEDRLMREIAVEAQCYLFMVSAFEHHSCDDPDATLSQLWESLEDSREKLHRLLSQLSVSDAMYHKIEFPIKSKNGVNAGLPNCS